MRVLLDAGKLRPLNSVSVDSSKLTGEWPYTIKIQLIAGMIPPNLIDAIKGTGFDYGLSARKLAEEVTRQNDPIRGHQVLHVRELQLKKSR